VARAREEPTQTPAVPESVRPPLTGGAGAILALQRRAGNRAVGRVLARVCQHSEAPPSADDVKAAKDHVFSVALRAATSGYPGVTFTLTHQNCDVRTGYRMEGEPGTASVWTADDLHEDLTYGLKWVFESPGEYTIELRRNKDGELAMTLWEPVRRFGRTPGMPSSKPGSNVVIVIGSPSPGQQYPLQFVTAALLNKQGEAVWYVERTGYEAAGVDLSRITDKAPGGRVRWITPAAPLVDQLNSLPDGSVRHMVVYSHGLAGIATLRYGWGEKGKPDYGLSRDDARRIDGEIFSDDALVDLESCQGGTNLKGGSLAQVIADRTGRKAYGWTGRTSYKDVNRGTGGVRGSEYDASRDAFREFWVRNFEAGAEPERKTFKPRR
jgi:hypothetical protein